VFGLMFLRDQCPEKMAGQKSLMKSTWQIKSCFDLVLYLCSPVCTVWDLRYISPAIA
jgi:hypothetical protein